MLSGAGRLGGVRIVATAFEGCGQSPESLRARALLPIKHKI